MRSVYPKRRKRHQNRPLLLNREILTLIRKKKRPWRKVKQSEKKKEYKQMKKEVRNIIRNAKRRFEKGLADGNCGDSVARKKRFYAFVKQRTKARPTVGPLEDDQGNLVREDTDMAEVLNKFFTRVTFRIFPAWQAKDHNLKWCKSNGRNGPEKKQETKGSPDMVGPPVLQELVNEILSPLAEVMNRIMEEGELPEDWKTADVTPIYKGGSKVVPGNYRPVSLTSVMCKLS